MSRAKGLIRDIARREDYEELLVKWSFNFLMIVCAYIFLKRFYLYEIVDFIIRGLFAASAYLWDLLSQIDLEPPNIWEHSLVVF